MTEITNETENLVLGHGARRRGVRGHARDAGASVDPSLAWVPIATNTSYGPRIERDLLPLVCEQELILCQIENQPPHLAVRVRCNEEKSVTGLKPIIR